nr:tetratricopeptide repeat protein [Acidovorax sp. D4N7]
MDVLAYIYLEHGLPDKAAVLLSARNLLAPDDARVLLTWALALVRSGKPEKALQTLERLAMLGAMGAEFHLVRAQALQMLDRQAEAASAMRAHVAMEPRATPPSSTWPGLPA